MTGDLRQTAAHLASPCDGCPGAHVSNVNSKVTELVGLVGPKMEPVTVSPGKPAETTPGGYHGGCPSALSRHHELLVPARCRLELRSTGTRSHVTYWCAPGRVLRTAQAPQLTPASQRTRSECPPVPVWWLFSSSKAWAGRGLLHRAHRPTQHVLKLGLQHEFRAKLKDKPNTAEPSLKHSNCCTSAAEFNPAAKAHSASEPERWQQHQETQRWPDPLDQGALPGSAGRKQGEQGSLCQQSLQKHVLKMGTHL